MDPEAREPAHGCLCEFNTREPVTYYYYYYYYYGVDIRSNILWGSCLVVVVVDVVVDVVDEDDDDLDLEHCHNPARSHDACTVCLVVR